MTPTCPATCELADDHGDNEATMRCQLPEGHAGPHRELFRAGRCLLFWTDEDDKPVIASLAAEGLIKLASSEGSS